MQTPADLFRWFSDVLAQPSALRIFCWSFVGCYYIVSIAFIIARARAKPPPIARRDGWFDRISSLFWILFAAILIWSLVANAMASALTLGRLVEFYVFFLFLFAFLYGLLEWHWPGKLKGVSTRPLEAELQYLLLSISTQTTGTVGRVTPSHWITEALAALQTLLGLAFVVVWIATAIGAS